ncbi:MAG: sporulation protein YtfJ [Clostridiales bacterium]|nr:sporulation protein YtfJ [Clostridiales bacterium]
MSENKQSEIIRTSLDSIKTILDANTVVGEPIVTPSGTTLIPISKITVGYASGGLDYLKKDTPVQNGKPVYNNFGGGGGTGLTVSPVAFITIDADGKTDILNINAPVTAEDTVSRVISLIENSPSLVEKLKAAFSKK